MLMETISVLYGTLSSVLACRPANGRVTLRSPVPSDGVVLREGGNMKQNYSHRHEIRCNNLQSVIINRELDLRVRSHID